MFKTIASSGHHALVQAMTEARKAAGLTQSDVANALKCQQSLIARIESGQRRIDAIELVRWARVLGVDPQKFVDVISAHLDK